MKTAHAQKIVYAEVGQDKDAGLRVRQALQQPVIRSNTPRTPPKITKSQRLQNHSTKRKLHQVAAWVEEPIILQLQDMARVQHLLETDTLNRQRLNNQVS
jgi:hypothetical protein